MLCPDALPPTQILDQICAPFGKRLSSRGNALLVLDSDGHRQRARIVSQQTVWASGQHCGGASPASSRIPRSTIPSRCKVIMLVSTISRASHIFVLPLVEQMIAVMALARPESSRLKQLY
jgi:hypothetical protein